LKNAYSLFTKKNTTKILDDLFKVISGYSKGIEVHSEKWNEKDVVLITYGDSIKTEAETPLRTLHNFLNKNLKEQLSVVHILPFFPYSSDDGFSVIDFRKVNPELGDWDDIVAILGRY
jgi:sucrose phosphorylase